MFTLVLKQPDAGLWDRVARALRKHGVEFRRGTAGVGGQLRQPNLREVLGNKFDKYLNVDHVTFYGRHLSNYQMLKKDRILNLCAILDAL